MSGEETKLFSVNLGVPQRAAKDGYLVLFYNARVELGSLIKDWRGITDPRFLQYTKFVITSICDDEIRDSVMNKLMTKLKELDKKSMGNEEKASELFDICIDVLGDVTAFYDEFVGISHTLKIGGYE